MDEHDATRKRLQRAAYADYQRLQGRLNRLPQTDPEYPALDAQAYLAEAYWRDLMDHPPVPDAPLAPAITVYRAHLAAWLGAALI